MVYKPITPFNVPAKLLIPEWVTISGVRKKKYPEPSNAPTIYVSFRTFGGTEVERNGVYGIENTATVETWFRPDITADCQIHILQTGKTYEILGDPENIEMRNQMLKIRVRYVGGGA